MIRQCQCVLFVQGCPHGKGTQPVHITHFERLTIFSGSDSVFTEPLPTRSTRDDSFCKFLSFTGTS